MVKRLIVVLALVGAFFVVSPAKSASALTQCNGAYTFASHVYQPVGKVTLPTVDLGNSNINCVMNIYMAHHFGVYHLQVTLKNCYGQNIATDAWYGNDTRNALKNAQRWEGIPNDGWYGPQTRDSITWWTEKWSGGFGCYKVSF